MTERDAKLEMAEQLSDLGKRLVSMSETLLALHSEINERVQTIVAEIDVLLHQVREADSERSAKRHHH